MGWVIEYLQKMELRYWWKNMNKLVERKAFVDNVWIEYKLYESASYSIGGIGGGAREVTRDLNASLGFRVRFESSGGKVPEDNHRQLKLQL